MIVNSSARLGGLFSSPQCESSETPRTKKSVIPANENFRFGNRFWNCCEQCVQALAEYAARGPVFELAV